MSSSETKTRLKELVNTAEGASDKLEQLIGQLHKGAMVASISSEAHAQLKRLLNISEHASQAIMQQRIINSLAFEGMHGRFDAVHHAHYKTFEWIFQPDDEKSALRRSTSELFRSWLSSGDSIFHIAGKLGSGKSTLMKFLCEHECTQNELQKWAGM